MSEGANFFRVAKWMANEYPVVEGTRCVQVHIPDDISFMPVLAAMLAEVGNTWSSRGTVEQRRAWARMWQDAYANTDWDSCMNCEELTECITPLLEAQTLQITNNILNQIRYGAQSPAQPMSGSESASNTAAGTNPTCDPDILWSQCLALVQYTNRAIVDVLEKVEVATNIVEMVALIDEIPILGIIAQQFGSELATQTINYFQEAVLESYTAQYTEAVENEISCELFCLCRGDCIVSVDRVFGLFESRLNSLIPTAPGDFIDLLEIFAGLDFDDTEVVDVCFYFAWGAAKLAQILFGDPVTTATLQLVVQLAVNDASDDWILLCPECECWTDYGCDNPIPELDIEVGLSGVCETGIYIVSEVYAPFANSSTVIASCEIPLVDNERVTFITNYKAEPNYVVTVVVDGNTYETNPAEAYALGGRWAFDAVLPGPTTGTLEQFLLKTSDGDTTEVDLYAVRLWQTCP